MDAIEASTVVYVPPAELYEFIREFSGTSDYSEHLDRVRQYGDGGPGTDYRITVSWWTFSYTSETRVTAVEPPERIDWRSTSGLDAKGSWLIDPLDAVPADPPAGVDAADATELRLRIEFDAETVRRVRLPGPLSVDAVLETVKPVVVSELESVVEAMVADLEGGRRPVDLTVHRAPSRL